jgi:hypothetical protein
MDTQKAAAELKVIRQLMERPIRFSTMSGLSGIWAGAAALSGLGLDLYFTHLFQHQGDLALWANMAVWGGVFAVAFAGVWALTRRREKKQGMPAWSSVKTRILLTILPPFLCGVGLTAVLVLRWLIARVPGGADQLDLVPAIWMLFYGIALWQLGEFSPPEVRVLGAAFILAGLASAALFQSCPYFTLGVTFGGFHLAYGSIIWMRYGG